MNMRWICCVLLILVGTTANAMAQVPGGGSCCPGSAFGGVSSSCDCTWAGVHCCDPIFYGASSSQLLSAWRVCKTPSGETCEQMAHYDVELFTCNVYIFSGHCASRTNCPLCTYGTQCQTVTQDVFCESGCFPVNAPASGVTSTGSC